MEQGGVVGPIKYGVAVAMNVCLLQKEIGSLKLILWLVVAISAVECCYLIGTGFPDIQTTTERAEAAKDAPLDVIADMMIYGMLIGVYLLGQEREYKTTPFLDGLPVRRVTLFFYKFLAACVIVALVAVASQSFDAYFTWLSRDSLSPDTHWQQPLAQFAIMFLLGYSIVGVSTLVSFSRKWFPLLAGLIIWTVLLVRTSESSLSSWLDTPMMVRWSLEDGRSAMPWQPIAGHFIVGTLGWLGALIGFQHRDGWLTRQVDRMSQWRLTSWGVAFGQLAAATVWIFVLISTAGGDGTQTVESQAAGEARTSMLTETTPGVVGFGREQTDYYEVVFRESQRRDVERCIGWFDELHEQVRKFLGDPPGPPGKIVIDTASPVMSHAAAQTNWTKIRAPLARAKDDSDFCRILRHETAHVYIEQLSGGRASEYFRAMRMFHEGVASLSELADNIQAETEPRLLKERWACGVDSRGRIPLNVLCDDERLIALRDPNVVYPLGFIVAQSMIDVGGPTLPRRFLEALKNAPIPPGAKPSEVWRILLQKCNTSFDHVIAAYETRLDILAERERAFIDSLPRLEADVSIETDEIVVRTQSTSTAPKSALPHCLFERDRAITKLPESIPMTAANEFRLPRSSISGNKLRLLIGWQTPDSEGLIYEPWQEVELKK